MDDPQDPHFDDGIELLNTEPEATTHTTEPSNTDTEVKIHIAELSDTDSDATIRDPSHRKPVGITILLAPPPPPPPPSSTPTTAQPAETIRIATFYIEIPHPGPPNSVITHLTALRPLSVEKTEFAPRDTRMAEYLAGLGVNIWAGDATNRAAETRWARYWKGCMWALGRPSLPGITFGIVVGLHVWKATKMR
ncbi:hypothetical protein VE02_09974 [Pseudogymnoascus sp. 03VT05]|nr:hypothetical protein VE02_09974 [Pseudogymnoascus sp. 03VT05]